MPEPDVDAGERRASWLELVFDLVLVAAVAALASQLHEDHSVRGLVVFAGLFVPVWWAWWGFTWYSAAFNDDDIVNRVALFCGMAGVAALAAGASGAAHGRSDTFVVGYAGLFALLALLYARAWWRIPASRRLCARYLAGDAMGAALWLASLALDEGTRPVVWAAAMLVLMGAPVLAAASHDALSYDPHHIAERYGLFTLIVLGESVVATVAGFEGSSSAPAVLVGLLGLVVAAAVWWLYFDRWRGMPAGTLASGWVWAQGHLLVFAGIAAAAVGVEFTVEATADHHGLELADRLPLGAGLAAYFAGMAVIRAATRRVDAVVALRAGAACAVLAIAFAGGLAPLTFVAAIAGVATVEVVADLIGWPPDSAPPKPTLPHELARPRGPTEQQHG